MYSVQQNVYNVVLSKIIILNLGNATTVQNILTNKGFNLTDELKNKALLLVCRKGKVWFISGNELFVNLFVFNRWFESCRNIDCK